MADSNGLEGPELTNSENCEVAAIVDVTQFSPDGQSRSIIIGQEDNEAVIAITVEDAEKLAEFLKDAILYVKEYRARITQ
jgi:hypothetical protein